MSGAVPGAASLGGVLVLAIDSATAAVVVGVADDSGVLAQRVGGGTLRHGETLAPAVRDVLAEVGRSPAELTAVVVGSGPGPFTGLRVGLVTAAALGDALEIPVHGVGSLDAVALGWPETLGTTYVATDARRREVYWARYVDGHRLAGPHVGRADDVLAALTLEPADRIVGAGAVLYDLPGAVTAGPTVAGLLAAARPALTGDRPPEPLRAEYLRRPDATEPRPRTPAS